MDPEVGRASDIYRQFMEEIKARLEVVKEAVGRLRMSSDAPKAYLDAEFAFLQVRFICELVALAALAAHKPFGLNSGLMKSWNARKTFETLARLNAQCFPRPAKVKRFADGSVQFDVRDRNALKREDLQRIYDQCGETLHRGAIRHAFAGKAKVYDIDRLDGWCRQIGALLSDHVIMVLEKGLVLLIRLTGGPDNSVQVVITQAPGPSVYIPQTE